MSFRRRDLLLGGRAAFSPLELGTALKVWLDAADPTTLFQDSALTTPATADTDPVGGWKSKDTAAHNVLQATAGFRPLLKLAQLNGKPAIRFDGVDDFIKAAGFTLAQPVFVMLAISQRTWTVNKNFCDGNASETMLVYQTPSSPQVSQFAAVAVANAISPSLASFQIISSLFSGAASYNRLNASAAVTGGNPGTVSPGGFTLGSRSDGLSTKCSTIDVAEVVVLNVAPSAAIQAQLGNYLAGKWGIAAFF